jgi:hypothetical protein
MMAMMSRMLRKMNHPRDLDDAGEGLGELLIVQSSDGCR